MVRCTLFNGYGNQSRTGSGRVRCRYRTVVGFDAKVVIVVVRLAVLFLQCGGYDSGTVGGTAGVRRGYGGGYDGIR